MSNWKFTDATNAVVFRINDGGSCESCLFSVLPEGTIVEPANPAPAPTQSELIQAFKGAIQQMLDAAAVVYGYDDIVSATSYAGYPNAFQAEAISFGVWRADVWTYGYAEMAKVIAGTRPMPTIAQILSELPTRVLP